MDALLNLKKERKAQNDRAGQIQIFFQEIPNTCIYEVPKFLSENYILAKKKPETQFLMKRIFGKTQFVGKPSFRKGDENKNSYFHHSSAIRD
jgi:hypothetical protein